MEVGKRYTMRVRNPDGTISFYTGDILSRDGPLLEILDKFKKKVHINIGEIMQAKEV